MNKFHWFTRAIILALLVVNDSSAWARGFGGFGAGRGGGGIGARFGGAGIGGAGLRGADLGGGENSAARFAAGRFGAGQLGAGLRGGFGGGFGGGALRSRLENAGVGGLAGSGLETGLRQRFGGRGLNDVDGAGAGTRPTNGSLRNFLGLPSDGGLHHLSGETQSPGSRIYDDLRAGDRPQHNIISGETQSPGSRLYDSIRAGNRPRQNVISGQTQSRGSQLYDRIRAGDGPLQNYIPGETQSRGSQIYDAARSARQNFIPGETQSIGSRAYDYYRTRNHPLRPISPWHIHNNAVIIRRNFNNYFYFTGPWYRRYPGAWNPTAWAYGSPWIYAPWPTLSVWMGYPTASPIDYDLGTNVLYQNNSVYVNGNDVGTTAQYYQQAQQLADNSAQPQPGSQEQWMPLGVFALSQSGQTSASAVLQLAVDREGVIRGNYVNSVSGKNEVVKGGVDRQTQRAAWIIGDNSDTVFDTGLYNLTKEETPVLVHIGEDRTEQWLMVRLQEKDQNQESAAN